jgi:hypothetical protein
VSAWEWRSGELQCDHPRCYKRIEGERGIRGSSGETIAALRKRAGKDGWTLVRSRLGRPYDKDYCPGHKPEAAG